MKSIKPRAALLILVGLFAGMLSLGGHSALPAAVVPAMPLTDGRSVQLPSLAPILEQVTPAVVNISTRGHIAIQNNPLLSDPFFRRFFDIPNNLPRERQTQSLGSGVIVDAQRGYVLTNNHVIANADEVTVTLRDGRNLKAKLIGTDKDTDVAVIQVPAEGLTAVRLGDSARLRVGDFVVAIGNPFGLGQTATSGIVSALGRTGLGLLGVGGYEDFIQTDASINPGNSGGPLINLSGELVGINTAILAPGGGNIGIGFAIPINMAHDVMEQLVKFGKVERGQLGLQVQDLTPELAQAFNLPLDGLRGAVITQVLPESAADKAGLKAGDVITAVNGQGVRDAGVLRNSVGLSPVGKKVRLEVVRDGRAQTIELQVTAGSSGAPAAGQDDPRLAGVVFGAVDERSALFGRINGIPVMRVEEGSLAAQAGLRPGDIVTSINRKPVRTPDDLVNATQGNRREPLLFNVQRGEGALFIAIQPPQ
ncbi:MAG: DegQ family serine endoprotease [Gammaproteobacteria bacterium]